MKETFITNTTIGVNACVLIVRIIEMNDFEKLFMRAYIRLALDDDQRIHKIGKVSIPESVLRKDMLECLK